MGTCFWNGEKCGPTQGDGYTSECPKNPLASYTDGLKYKGQNIQTADGVQAYVTAVGVAKRYADYEATAGKRGCPTSTQTVNETWAALGFPAGAAMAAGQSCGREAQFVTAAPPKNAFDSDWYSATYALPSEQDAYQDWVATGQAQGRPPNPNILASMAQLGKVGYVDANAQLRPLPPKGVQYVGFTAFPKQSNVVGTKMQDCAELAQVNYGDRVALVHKDVPGAITSDGALAFVKDQNAFKFVLRPMDTTTRTAAPIKFGDGVSLSASTTNYSSTCGAWGCKVGQIDNATMALGFGPGGATGGTVFTVNPVNSGNAVGSALPYDTPFTLSAVIPVPYNSLFQGEVMKPGNSIRSANNKYAFVFRTDGYVALYNGVTEIWKADTGDETPVSLQVNDSGQLEAINGQGVVYWQSENTTAGSAPFALAVQDNGAVVLYDKAMTPLWTAGQANSDAPGETQTVYAAIAGQNVVFTTTATKQAVFTFSGETAATGGCDLTALQKQCGEGCYGFVVDTATNEWQPIQDGTEFTVKETAQDFYMKTPSAQLGDKSCIAGPAAFIPPDVFANYASGPPMVPGGANQCASPSPFPAPPPKTDFKALGPGFPDLRGKLQQAAANEAKTTSLLDKIKKAKLTTKKPNLTLEKQDEDATVVDRLFKTRYSVWSFFALLFISLYVLNRTTGGKYLGTTVKAVSVLAGFVALYLAVIFYKRWF
jgi:hypothetical protein